MAVITLQFYDSSSRVLAVEPLALESFDPPARVAKKRAKSNTVKKVALSNKKQKKHKKQTVAPKAAQPKVEPFKAQDVATLDSEILSKHEANLNTFKAATVKNFSPSLLTDAASSEEGELIALSFIAQSAAQGQLSQALTLIPREYKSSPLRTYRTTPYFNHLVATSSSLIKATKAFDQRILAASDPYELLGESETLSYLQIKKGDSATIKLLQNIADSQSQSLSETQLATIMGAWATLSKTTPDLAELIKEKAQDAATQFVSRFLIKDGELLCTNQNFSEADLLLAGARVAQFAKVLGDEGLELLGWYLFNKGFVALKIEDAKVLAKLYPALISDNTYYPHFEFLGEEGGAVVWAYTVATATTYQSHRMADGRLTITLSMDFPMGLSHHTIFGGLKPFTQIYIYDISFRSDPRFETYNSSGYVYKMDTSLFLLKSRHRTQTEKVRLIY